MECDRDKTDDYWTGDRDKTDDYWTGDRDKTDDYWTGDRDKTDDYWTGEIMTILIGFHGSRYRTFKDFYRLQVMAYWSKAMPNLVSYNRFVELMSYALLALCCYARILL